MPEPPVPEPVPVPEPPVPAPVPAPVPVDGGGQVLNTGLVREQPASSVVVAEYEVDVEVKVVIVLVLDVIKKRWPGWNFIKCMLWKTFGATWPRPLETCELDLAGLDGHAVEGEGAGDGQQNEERAAVHGVGDDDEEDSPLLVKLRLMNTAGFPFPYIIVCAVTTEGSMGILITSLACHVFMMAQSILTSCTAPKMAWSEYPNKGGSIPNMEIKAMVIENNTSFPCRTDLTYWPKPPGKGAGNPSGGPFATDRSA